MSVSKKCFNTVWPKEPVPPVISRVELWNADIKFIPLSLFKFLITLFIKNNSDSSQQEFN